MKIASWNVNSIKMRLDPLADWLRRAAPDVVCLQELKCETKAFPAALFEDMGYNAAVAGQKGYNGVAILSKSKLEDVSVGLPGDADDDQARYIEAVLSRPGGAIRIASIYLPNGNPADGPKYDYKLAWMARLEAHLRTLLALEEPLILAGDYNVMPQPEDVYDPDGWRDDALFKLDTRRAFRRLLHLGLEDAFRACSAEAGRYTFWDYQAGAWPKNHGLRIDHLLLSPEAAARLASCDIDKAPRGREKPSDHAPIWAQFRL